MSTSREIKYSAKMLIDKIDNKDDSSLVRYLKKLIEEKKLLNVLLDIKFIPDRSIFHVLVLKEKPQSLSYLLRYVKNQPEKSIFNSAIKLDRLGRTILHCAINPDSDIYLLQMILNFSPDLLNVQDFQGDTPLHYAVKCKNNRIVSFLVGLPAIDRSIQNAKGQTVFDVAGKGSPFEMAILNPKLELISCLDPRKRKKYFDDCVAEDLKGLDQEIDMDGMNSQFICRTSFDTDDSIQHLPSTSLSSRFQVTAKKVNVEAEALRDILSGETNDELYQIALKRLFSRSIDMCDISTGKLSVPVVSNLLKDIYPFVNELYVGFQNLNCHKIKMIAELMFMQRELVLNSDPIFDLSRVSELIPDEEMRHDIWLLVSCQDSLHSKRILDPVKIKAGVLYLISKYSATDVVMTLRVIYHTLDTHQKMTANMICLLAAIFHTMNFAGLDRKFHKQLNLYLRFMSNTSSETIDFFKKYLTDFMSDSKFFYSSHIVKNFIFLSNSLEEDSILKNRESFESLVDRALLLKREDRHELLVSIAAELKLLTVRFYRDISIKELSKSGIDKNGDYNACHPVIARFTKEFNSLSNFFIWKILNQPRNNLNNCADFIIELARYTCNMHGEKSFPDLAGAALFATIFQKSDIERLHIFSDLSAEDKAVVEAIDRITSVKNNSILMRDVLVRYATALPFPANYLKDIQFAIDGNKDSMSRAVAVGSILSDILSAKLFFNFSCAFHATNLPLFLSGYTPKNEDQLGHASFMIKPGIHLLDVALDDKALVSLFNKINQYLLDFNLLPPLACKEDIASSSIESIKLIMWFYSNKLLKLEDDLKKTTLKCDSTQLMSNFDLFKSTVTNMVNKASLICQDADAKRMSFINPQLVKIENIITELTALLGSDNDAAKRMSKRFRTKSRYSNDPGLFRQPINTAIVSSEGDDHAADEKAKIGVKSD